MTFHLNKTGPLLESLLELGQRLLQLVNCDPACAPGAENKQTNIAAARVFVAQTEVQSEIQLQQQQKQQQR